MEEGYKPWSGMALVGERANPFSSCFRHRYAAHPKSRKATVLLPSPAGEGVAHSVTDEACCKAVEEVETEGRKQKGSY